MTIAAHTAGKLKYEWLTQEQAPRYERGEPAVWPIVIHVDGGSNAGEEICSIEHEDGVDPVDWPSDRKFADAARIVLAWNCHDELLAALERALQIVGAMADGSSMIEHARAMYEPEAVCRQMHAAIAKAKGTNGCNAQPTT